MVDIQAELRRQPAGGGPLVAWELVADVANDQTGRADPVIDYGARRGLTDFEIRLDYDVRTDGNPVYVGKNFDSSATSAATWFIQKLFYDSSNRLTRVRVKIGAWDNRTTIF